MVLLGPCADHTAVVMRLSSSGGAYLRSYSCGCSPATLLSSIAKRAILPERTAPTPTSSPPLTVASPTGIRSRSLAVADLKLNAVDEGGGVPSIPTSPIAPAPPAPGVATLRRQYPEFNRCCRIPAIPHFWYDLPVMCRPCRKLAPPN